MTALTEVVDFVENARQLINTGKVPEANEPYLKAIEILEKEYDGSDTSKAQLWSTKAEYFYYRSNFKGEERRKRIYDCLRMLNACSKLGEEYATTLRPRIREIINRTILAGGCIVHETDTHVVIGCPIKIRNMGAGRFGTSIGAYYKKAECSICGLDALDEKCAHVPGEEYEGKVCSVNAGGLVFDHIALTFNPKDPRCLLTELSEPKKDFYKDFDPEQLKIKIETNAPLICTLCKENKIDPSEITIEKFFEMQGEKLELESVTLPE